MTLPLNPFAYNYPLWLCVHESDDSNVFGNIAANKWKIALLFSTRDRAKAYSIAKNADKASRYVTINDDQEFIDRLNRLTFADYTHVAFNHDPHSDDYHQLNSIGGVIKELEDGQKPKQ